MDAKLVAQCKSPTPTLAHWKPKHPCVVGVLARADISGETRKTNVYKDSLFDHIAINHLSKCVQEATGSFPFNLFPSRSSVFILLFILNPKYAGLRNSKSGYESLVEAATVASQNFSPIQQHQLVIEALERAFPKPMLLLVSSLH